MHRSVASLSLCVFAGLAACSPPAPATDASVDAIVTDSVAAEGAVDVPSATDAGADARPGSCVVQGGEFCFLMPDMPVVAVNGDASGPPNTSCAAPTVMNTAAPIAVTGVVRDFQDNTLLPGAMIAAFGTDDFSTAPLGMATTDAMGHFMFTLAAGAPNRLHWRILYADGLDTYALQEDFSLPRTMLDVTRNSVSRSSANGIAALIGVVRRVGTSVIAGAIEDCDGHGLSNVIATLTTAPATGPTGLAFVAGAQTYYFANGVPVRRANATSTTDDGLFVFIQAPATTGSTRYYLQGWGFRTAADVARGPAGLTLLSQQQLPALADSVMSLGLTSRVP